MRIAQVNTFYLNFLGVFAKEGFGHSDRVERTPDFGFVSPVLPFSSCVILGKSPDLHFLTTEWRSKSSVRHVWHDSWQRSACSVSKHLVIYKALFKQLPLSHREDLKPVGFKKLLSFKYCFRCIKKFFKLGNIKVHFPLEIIFSHIHLEESVRVCARARMCCVHFL